MEARRACHDRPAVSQWAIMNAAWFEARCSVPELCQAARIGAPYFLDVTLTVS
jgi:hypothetical protein